MTIWLLTAKKDLSSNIDVFEARQKYGKTFRKGRTLEVHASTVGGDPNHEECIKTQKLEGY